VSEVIGSRHCDLGDNLTGSRTPIERPSHRSGIVVLTTTLPVVFHEYRIQERHCAAARWDANLLCEVHTLHS